MVTYKNRTELIEEIRKRGDLFIKEFDKVNEEDKDIVLDEIDRSPSNMIAYQLGWMNLILEWEEKESEGIEVITPKEGYKWNNLGTLYKSFYDEYGDYTLRELEESFLKLMDEIVVLINSYSDEELFIEGGRAWAASTPSNWPIWKWIHINTVAPFKSFRTKIRKWKKIKY